MKEFEKIHIGLFNIYESGIKWKIEQTDFGRKYQNKYGLFADGVLIAEFQCRWKQRFKEANVYNVVDVLMNCSRCSNTEDKLISDIKSIQHAFMKRRKENEASNEKK